MTVIDFPAAIKLLAAGGVEFIVVGGIAATIHGSAHITYDLDIVYRRTPENIDRLATVQDVNFLCVSLRRLILLKRAAGRPKDLNMVAELEALLEEQERNDGPPNAR